MMLQNMRPVRRCAGAHELGAFAQKRVFDIDIEHCPHCGGRLKIIAAIEDPAVIVSILTHLGLPARTAAYPGTAR